MMSFRLLSIISLCVLRLIGEFFASRVFSIYICIQITLYASWIRKLGCNSVVFTEECKMLRRITKNQNFKSEVKLKMRH